jgi:hypothetical protein
MQANKSQLGERLRVAGLILFPLLAIAAAALMSRRQILIFLCSVSFQTNFAGFLYLALRENRLGRIASHLLLFVALVWFGFLSGKEDSIQELTFNILLHYVQPGIVVLHWLVAGDHSSRAFPILGSIMVVYPFCLKILESRILGYKVYPVIDEHPYSLAACLATSTIVLSLIETQREKKEE